MDPNTDTQRPGTDDSIATQLAKEERRRNLEGDSDHCDDVVDEQARESFPASDAPGNF